MRCLVLVKFLPGGSVAPEELFARINARWSWLEETHNTGSKEAKVNRMTDTQTPRTVICITDYESIEQLAADLAVMPGAGISNVEVFPVSESEEAFAFTNSIPDEP